MATRAPVSGAVLGIIANPMSGRDIRRIVARASVFPNAEKSNMVLRLIESAGTIGVERVLMSTDTMGLAAAVRRSESARRMGPAVEYVELDDVTGTARDTHVLVERMRERGARVIALLGGDGTVRAASAVSGDAILLPLSTGTNNAFSRVWEATVAGMAAALVAIGAVEDDQVVTTAKVLQVQAGDRREIALVDACVSVLTQVGSKALWQPDTLRHLVCTFAEPSAIGLSSIPGLLHPVRREEDCGVRVRFADPPETAETGTDPSRKPGGDGPAGIRTVLAPISPGVVAAVPVAHVAPVPMDDPFTVDVPRGTVAVDGEREIEFGPADPVTITLRRDGPRVLDVVAAMAVAARDGLLSDHPLNAFSGSIRPHGSPRAS